MRWHYPDLGVTSDWSHYKANLLQPIRSTTHSWVVTHHYYRISTVISQTSFGMATCGGIPKCWLFSQAIKWVQLHFLLLLQIHVYLIFCILTVITSILMFWLVMPIIVNDNREVSWNMFFGSFLGLVAITFVVSMKGSFVAFKASFFQYNCCNKVPQLQVSESLQAQYREK